MLPASWLKPFEGCYAREVPLSRWTTWRIGGPAELLLQPTSVAGLASMVSELWRAGVPWRLIGGGSNLLVADRGVRGAVISLRHLRRVQRAGPRVVAEAGAQLHGLVRFAERQGLTGAEPLAGIPGHVGGAVFGNAGGRYGAIASLVRSLDLVEPDGTLVSVAPGHDFFAYRRSRVGDRIVVRVHLELEPSETRAVRGRGSAIRQERADTQPGWIGNAGCVFKNPARDSAGRLIDAAGCKGLREGGVEVSRIHANFFENHGRAQEADVLRLVDRVRERVRAVHGVELDMEVRRWS